MIEYGRKTVWERKGFWGVYYLSDENGAYKRKKKMRSHNVRKINIIVKFFNIISKKFCIWF